MPEFEIRQPVSEEEAAAVAAALEVFTADTAPAAQQAAPGMDPWLEAALVEGVNARDLFGPGHLDGHGRLG